MKSFAVLPAPHIIVQQSTQMEVSSNATILKPLYYVNSSRNFAMCSWFLQHGELNVCLSMSFNYRPRAKHLPKLMVVRRTCVFCIFVWRVTYLDINHWQKIGLFFIIAIHNVHHLYSESINHKLRCRFRAVRNVWMSAEKTLDKLESFSLQCSLDWYVKSSIAIVCIQGNQ